MCIRIWACAYLGNNCSTCNCVLYRKRLFHMQVSEGLRLCRKVYDLKDIKNPAPIPQPPPRPSQTGETDNRDRYINKSVRSVKIYIRCEALYDYHRMRIVHNIYSLETGSKSVRINSSAKCPMIVYFCSSWNVILYDTLTSVFHPIWILLFLRTQIVNHVHVRT